MDRIRVFVTGACGKMGSETIKTILNQSDIELVGASDIRRQGEDVGKALGINEAGIKLQGLVDEQILQDSKADIMVDFTNPSSVFSNAKTALRANVVPVIGATGLDEQELAELEEMAVKQNGGIFVAPNFALGAILMIKFAQETAKYFKHVDIIEYHHDQKLDAPSGTALRTAEKISEVREPMIQGDPNEYEKLPGSRGGDMNGIHIHSVRLPGLIAHQEVLFGGYGQTLMIRHDAYTRETYMPGILLAIRKSYKIKGLVVGLENFLD